MPRTQRPEPYTGRQRYRMDRPASAAPVSTSNGAANRKFRNPAGATGGIIAAAVAAAGTAGGPATVTTGGPAGRHTRLRALRRLLRPQPLVDGRLGSVAAPPHEGSAGPPAGTPCGWAVAPPRARRLLPRVRHRALDRLRALTVRVGLHRRIFRGSARVQASGVWAWPGRKARVDINSRSGIRVS